MSHNDLNPNVAEYMRGFIRSKGYLAATDEYIVDVIAVSTVVHEEIICTTTGGHIRTDRVVIVNGRHIGYTWCPDTETVDVSSIQFMEPITKTVVIHTFAPVGASSLPTATKGEYNV